MIKLIIYLLLSLTTINVNALNKIPNDSNTKYYKVYGNYENKENENYPYLDKEDYIYTNFTEFNETKPEEKEERKIEEKEVYKYEKAGPIDKIEITAYLDDISFKSIKIYDKNVEINYQLSSDYTNIKKENSITLIPNKEIELNNLYIKVNLGGIKNNYYTFRITYYGKDKQYQILNTSIPCQNENTIYVGNSKPIAYNILYLENQVETNKMIRYIGRVKLYRYQDKLYHQYKLNSIKLGKTSYKIIDKKANHNKKQTVLFTKKAKEIKKTKNQNIITKQSIIAKKDNKQQKYKIIRPKHIEKNKKNSFQIHKISIIVILILVLSKAYQLILKYVKMKPGDALARN